MKLSEKILYCRKKALLSQEALAERIGVSRQAISKWETGEASPEIGKLLSLAQVFGVTTDWLLSEDAPEPEAQPASAHTWVDDVPGMLGKLLRRYGWLFGVRLAWSGALFLAFGFLVRLVSGQFFSSGIIFEGDLHINPGMLYTMSDPFYDVKSMGSSIFSLFSGFAMLLGAVMLIAGVILAIKLRKLDRS